MSEVNWVPLSLSISLGNPTLLKTSRSASATRSVSIFGSVTASGYLVAKSTTVSMYRFPFSHTGDIGPTRSTATILKGSSVNGISPKGTLQVRPFGAVFWQMLQDLQNLVTSVTTPGQWKLHVIQSTVFFAPR